MQISNNYQIKYNYQPNFKSLNFYKSKPDVKKVLQERIPAEELKSFYKRLQESPVSTTLGLADGIGDRLDATVYYKHPDMKIDSAEKIDYLAENKFLNILNFCPRKFMNRVLMTVESTEETFQIGRYAK